MLNQVESATKAQPSRTALRLAMGLGAVLVLIAASLAVLRWSAASEDDLSGPPLPVGPAVPDFSLIERSGRTVTRTDLLGKIWIADFVFTRCSGPCPTLSARMQSLQLALADQPDVKLVTFTLDPTNDTPAVLCDYAKRFHADPDRWWFLTGKDQASLHELIEKGLKQTVIPAQGDQPIIHSEYIIVLDRQARLRAAHSGVDPESRRGVLRDVRKLLAEPREGT